MPFIPLYNIAELQDNTKIPKWGKVLNNNDPSGQQRIKVWLDGIFIPDDAEGSNLPWVRQINDTFLHGNGREAFSVPPIGSFVEVIWPYDKETPYYKGCPAGGGVSSGKFTSPTQWGWADESGFVFKVDAATNMFIMQTKGFTLTADSYGSYMMKTPGSLIRVDNGGNITINGGNISLEGSVVIEGKKFMEHKHSNGHQGDDTGGVV